MYILYLSIGYNVYTHIHIHTSMYNKYNIIYLRQRDAAVAAAWRRHRSRRPPPPRHRPRPAGTQFTFFTSSKVQILTQRPPPSSAISLDPQALIFFLGRRPPCVLILLYGHYICVLIQNLPPPTRSTAGRWRIMYEDTYIRPIT